jgi:hypothetical protein
MSEVEEDAWSPASKATLETSFEQFPKLPTEIRQMIWRLTIEENRVVELSNYEDRKTRSRTTYERRLTSKTLVPSILHTCSESRAIGPKFTRSSPLVVASPVHISTGSRISFHFKLPGPGDLKDYSG